MFSEKQLRDWDSVSSNPKRYFYITGALWEETPYPEDSNSLQEHQHPQDGGIPDARLGVS